MKFPLKATWLLGALVAPVFLTGCGALPVAVVIGSYAADGALIVTTDKSSTDHLISMNTNRDCGAWRSVTKGGPLCKDRPQGLPDPYRIDRTAPFRSDGESGVEVVQSAREGGKLLIGDEARDALSAHKPAIEGPSKPMTAVASVPGEARFGSAGQPAVAPTPEGAEVAAAGSRSKARR